MTSKYGKVIDGHVKEQFHKTLIGFSFGSVFGFIVGMLVMVQNVHAADENGEVVCMAKNIYFEAGNQPLAGKVAVAHVVLNRMDHSAYPKDICGVIYQAKWRENWKGKQVPIRNQCQFSWFCDGKSDEPLDTDTFFESYLIAQDVIMGLYPDITEGATHYHSLYVDPYWNESLNETVIITDHIFYK
jgi:spore germination cell wall hydrolase CwlJ-like protein